MTETTDATPLVEARELAKHFVLGGTLLLAHTHSLTDVKQSYLIELNHLPMGACGILAGWGRWLEIRGRGWPAKMGSWVWPICFTLIALLLIDYRET